MFDSDVGLADAITGVGEDAARMPTNLESLLVPTVIAKAVDLE